MAGNARVFAGAANMLLRTGRYSRGGLFRRLPGCSAWQSLGNGLPQDVEARAIVVHPGDANVIYVGTQDGPYRSIDGGDSWERLGFPDRGAVIWSLAIHPTRPDVMYAGTAPIALYRSEDGGDTWHMLRQVRSPAHCERDGFDSRLIRIAIEAGRPEEIYLALEVSGVLHSADGGETWKDVSAPLVNLARQPHLKSSVGGRDCGDDEGMLDSHAIALSAAAPGTAFLAVRMGLFRSDDAGASWRDLEIGRYSPVVYCRDVMVSPHDARVMYACVSPAAMSKDGALWRSDDLGQAWRRIDHGVKSRGTMMAVALHPGDPSCVYSISRPGDVFGTEDGGDSWQSYPLPEHVLDAYAVVCS